MRITRLFAVILLVALASPTRPAAAGSLFDPARHMRVDEVKPGMKGYGLSVFSGTKIERFDVEVISILRNFNPKRHVVLIRCSGANLEHSGAISGMSGSPVFLVDEQGRERMIGAFAYGWAFMKDPVAGVQPIEYMLELPEISPQDGDAAQNFGAPRANTKAADRDNSAAQGRVRWSINEVFPLPGSPVQTGLDAFPTNGLRSLEPNPKYFRSLMERDHLQPLASPLMVGGVPSGVLEDFTPIMRAYGISPLQAGGSTSPRPDAAESNVALHPGGVLAVPMVTGDIDLTAIGTITEVLDDRVFGFGHPFNNEGPVSFPMGTGEINGVLARVDQSLKLGSLLKAKGALTADQSVGVAGKIGQSPHTVPIAVRVVYADGSEDTTYRYEMAIHPRFTPWLSALAVASSMSGARELPAYHTIKYDLKLEFSNGEVIESSDVAVNSGIRWVVQGVWNPLRAVMENNPFEPVKLQRIKGNINVLDRALHAQILSVNLPKLKYKPGETLKGFVTHRPFRGAESVLEIELQLPSDLSDGTYQLVVSGWDRFVSDEQMAQPFRFTAESGEQMFDVLRDFSSLRHNALYVRLVRQADGVAVGRVAMPRLPSSRRQVLLGSGRSNTTPFVSSTIKTIPTEYVMEGEADFSIEIDIDEHVETAPGVKSAARPEPHATPAAIPADSKSPKPGRGDTPNPDPGKPENDDPAVPDGGGS